MKISRHIKSYGSHYIYNQDLLEIKSKEMSLQIPFRPEIIEQKEDHLELKVPGELYQDLWTAN